VVYTRLGNVQRAVSQLFRSVVLSNFRFDLFVECCVVVRAKYWPSLCRPHDAVPSALQPHAAAASVAGDVLM